MSIGSSLMASLVGKRVRLVLGDNGGLTFISIGRHGCKII